ncbi:hypothetical protein PIB30_000324 [Stylosanthes scabra]|uniref:Uncharacterized protein n=1 Tax=Stylosanthes scabra TaxID=79078 RepID=A0ABU6T223_9FABA|nr:hypothetical protein [Stylosanthes scabra]
MEEDEIGGNNDDTDSDVGVAGDDFFAVSCGQRRKLARVIGVVNRGRFGGVEVNGGTRGDATTASTILRSRLPWGLEVNDVIAVTVFTMRGEDEREEEGCCIPIWANVEYERVDRKEERIERNDFCITNVSSRVWDSRCNRTCQDRRLEIRRELDRVDSSGPTLGRPVVDLGCASPISGTVAPNLEERSVPIFRVAELPRVEACGLT